ncbi:Crp/Fnr family transcriptional regulator [Siphonobacter curvatus]|uniref:Crp/Fnr family transcriptional regulator n=1 Tax=Siphonobacter curvatus TaxID=2094562 RepID=A0A2S7IRP8_9BACT|nr:Crp/Fnr family transcriptional regulator [Siphonobacter curvatus]PQA60393.1 Crp/Fnr family transcriptional regulator [Siphonobacter curvatus]
MHPHFIQHIRKYVELTEEEVQRLLAYLKPISVPKKAYLLEEGQICRANYFVEKGCLRLFYLTEKGTEQITQFALENWWLADYMSYATQQPSEFYIQALEPTEVFAIPADFQNQLYHEFPQLERYFRLMFQRALAASQRRLKFLHDYSKEESYRNFVAHFPGFTQRIPQYMLASYLGLTPEYLSELRKKLV